MTFQTFFPIMPACRKTPAFWNATRKGCGIGYFCEKEEKSSMGMIGQNVILCVVFVLSGIVIGHTLKRFNFRLASKLFYVLFCVLLFYIPFFFGCNMMRLLSGQLMGHVDYAKTFDYFLSNIVSAPFLFMRSVTVVAAVVSIFAIVATVISAITIMVKIVDFISSGSSAKTAGPAGLFKTFKTCDPTESRRYQYKLLECFLN